MISACFLPSPGDSSGALGLIWLAGGGLLEPLGAILSALERLWDPSLVSSVALGSSGLDLGAILGFPGDHPGGPDSP